MLIESIGGKCPCCSYNKMFQRYGSLGHYLLDGCPNCGFGYGSNQHDDDVHGVDAWIGYGAHVLASVLSPSIDGEFMLRDGNIEIFQDTRYVVINDELLSLDKNILRKKIFDWMETQDPPVFESMSTVFKYDQSDVDNHLSTNPIIFKKI